MVLSKRLPVVVVLALSITGACGPSSPSAQAKACPKIKATYNALQAQETALIAKYGTTDTVESETAVSAMFAKTKSDFIDEITPLDNRSTLAESVMVFAAAMSLGDSTANTATLKSALDGIEKACP